MDVLAHSLWTNVMFRLIPATRTRSKTTWWGIFFGVFPDLFAFTPLFLVIFYNIIFLHQRFALARPERNAAHFPLEALTGHLYNISHSLITWAVVFAVSWLLARRMPWILFGWCLHILIDIFSHSNAFYPTPFLWPVSKFHVNGWSWGDPVFMAINYGSIALVYLFLVPYLKRKYANQKTAS